MKKLLLSLVALVMTSLLASADVYTFTPTAIETGGDKSYTYTMDPASGFSFTAVYETGTAPAYNANNKDARLYAGNEFTIAAPAGATMTKVVFNISTQGKKRLAPITASAGAIATQAEGDETVTWTGEAQTVTFTVGEKSDFGSDDDKAGQLDFSSLEITADGVTSKAQAGISFPGAEYTATVGQAFESPVLANPNNVTVTYTSSNEEVATVDATGVVTLVGAGTTEITAESAENDNFYAGSAAYTLVVEAAALADVTEISVDFANADIPLAEAGNCKVTLDGIEFSLNNCKKNQGYLMMYGSPTNQGSVEFSLEQDLKRAVFVSRSGASTNVTVQLTANGEKVGDAVTLANVENTFDIPAAYQAAGTVYRFEITNTKNAQLTKLALYVSAPEGKELAGISFPEESYSTGLDEAFESPVLSNPNNLEVTYASSNEEVATVDAEGKVTVVGKGVTTISATTEATDKFLSGYASYTLNVTVAVKNFAEVDALPKDEYVIIPFECVVTYVNGQNLYVKDAEGNAELVYGTTNQNYAVGDVIPAGWGATVSPYSGMPEVKPTNMQAATGTQEVVYADVKGADVKADIVNQVVYVTCRFDEATPTTKNANFTGVAEDETELTFRNNFFLTESAEADKTYKVLCAVATYNGTVQLYPISYTEDSGISTVDFNAIDNADVELYDLQGRRVNAAFAGKGLYIVRANGTARKVLVK